MKNELSLAEYSRYHQMCNTLLDRAKDTIPYIAKYIDDNHKGTFKIIETKEHCLVFESFYHQYRLSVLIEPEYLITNKRAKLVTHYLFSKSLNMLVLKEPLLLQELTSDFDDLGNIWLPSFFGEEAFAVEFREFLPKYIQAFVNIWSKNNFAITDTELDQIENKEIAR